MGVLAPISTAAELSQCLLLPNSFLYAGQTLYQNKQQKFPNRKTTTAHNLAAKAQEHLQVLT